MSKRTPPSESVVTSVLIQSRRRCCLCFGLFNTHEVKSGQIAHLDQNRENNAESNLAFLCLDHHDEYDSRTSQRKGMSIGEVKEYRKQLYVWNESRRLTAGGSTGLQKHAKPETQIDVFAATLNRFTASYNYSDAMHL